MAADPIARVQQAARAKRKADAEYTRSMLDAVAALQGSSLEFSAYTRVAEAAGTSRQAVRQLWLRTREHNHEQVVQSPDGV